MKREKMMFCSVIIVELGPTRNMRMGKVIHTSNDVPNVKKCTIVQENARKRDGKFIVFFAKLLTILPLDRLLRDVKT